MFPLFAIVMLLLHFQTDGSWYTDMACQRTYICFAQFSSALWLYNTYVQYLHYVLLSNASTKPTIRLCGSAKLLYILTYVRILVQFFGCTSSDEVVTFCCCIPIHWIIVFRENRSNKCIQLSITIIQSVYNCTNWIPQLNPIFASNVINWII